MNRTELLELHAELCSQAVDLMRGKNNDYAGEEDPFRNLVACERMNICSAQEGILIRVLDKISRLINFARGGELAHEGAQDSVLDIINYMVLYQGMTCDQISERISGPTGQALAEAMISEMMGEPCCGDCEPTRDPRPFTEYEPDPMPRADDDLKVYCSPPKEPAAGSAEAASEPKTGSRDKFGCWVDDRR